MPQTRLLKARSGLGFSAGGRLRRRRAISLRRSRRPARGALASNFAPDHAPAPDWPDGAPQQVHLDLHVEDPRAAHEEAISLGARLLQAAPDFSADEGHQVYADPGRAPVLHRLGASVSRAACIVRCQAVRTARAHGRLRSGMAKLIYVANVSLDGYIEDAHGSFDWTEPSDEVFTFITDLVRPVGTYLYGRRMYETMAVWETEPALAAQSELRADFANVWQAADKIVYSTTLAAVSTANTRLERRFDPDAVRDMKTSAASDLTVGGPTLAAHAFNAGLVDECQLFVRPVLVGGGKPAFPSDARVQLELLEEHRFGNGVVYLRYRTQS